MFSQTAEYALRAVVWLAENAGENPVGNQRIAAGTQVPETYLAKIMQTLAQEGLVTARRGVGGGFALNYEPHEITVYEIVNAVAPIQRITSCPLNLKTHDKMRCRMHASLDSALEQVEIVLSATTIAEILNDKSRPKPMNESRTG